MITIYSSTATSFTTNGLGILKDFTNNPVITEVLNGEYTLEFSYAKNGWLVDTIVEGNIIKANNQPFRIYDITKNLTDIKVLCKHIAFDLNNNFLEDVYPTDLTGAGALSWIFAGTQYAHSFTAWSDLDTDTHSARYVRKNVIEAMISADNSILKVWGGEFEYDNFTIKLHAIRGEDRGLHIRHGKNLTGVECNVDFSTVITRIMPIGNNELILPEKYIDSDLLADYPTPVVREIKFNVGVDEETTEEEAYDLLRAEVQKLYDAKIDEPLVSIKVNFIELSKVKEYEQYADLESVYLGDTVSIYIEALNIETTSRVVKTTWDCLKERYIKLELGAVMPNFVSNNKTEIEIITNEMANIDSTSILNQAQVNATLLINSAMGGYVLKTQSELLIMDTDDTATATKVWRWNINGLGYSSTGVNGTYTTAITNDGQIVADFITTGVLNGALIDVGTIEATSFSISANEKFRQNGNNIAMGTHLYDLSNWGLSLTRGYIESITVPEEVFDGLFWYCTEDNGIYKAGIVYHYVIDVWEETTLTRKELDNEISLISNFEVIENEETRNKATSKRFGEFYLSGEQDNEWGILIHKTDIVNLEKEKITLSTNIINNIEYGELYFFIDYFNKDVYNSGDIFTSIVYENATSLFKSSEDGLITIEAPIIKQENIIIGESGADAPEDTLVKWIYTEDDTTGILMEYLVDTWIPSTDTNIFYDGTKYWVFLAQGYQQIDITTFNGTRVLFGFFFVPAYVTNVGETAPENIFINTLWAKESTDELFIPIFIDEVFDSWQVIDITYTEAQANMVTYDEVAPFVSPKGKVDFYDTKIEYGDYSEWTPNPNELYGQNFIINENGMYIKKGNNQMFIDEDEIKATYLGQEIFSITDDQIFGQKMLSNETEIDGLICKKIEVDAKDTYIRYIR